MARRIVQHLRTSGVTAPSSADTSILAGEIAIGMDNSNPKIWFRKNNDEFAEFSNSLSSEITYSGKTLASAGTTYDTAIGNIYTEVIKDEKVTAEALYDLKKNTITDINLNGSALTKSNNTVSFNASVITSGGTNLNTFDISQISDLVDGKLPYYKGTFNADTCTGSGVYEYINLGRSGLDTTTDGNYSLLVMNVNGVVRQIAYGSKLYHNIYTRVATPDPEKGNSVGAVSFEKIITKWDRINLTDSTNVSKKVAEVSGSTDKDMTFIITDSDGNFSPGEQENITFGSDIVKILMTLNGTNNAISAFMANWQAYYKYLTTWYSQSVSDYVSDKIVRSGDKIRIYYSSMTILEYCEKLVDFDKIEIDDDTFQVYKTVVGHGDDTDGDFIKYLINDGQIYSAYSEPNEGGTTYQLKGTDTISAYTYEIIPEFKVVTDDVNANDDTTTYGAYTSVALGRTNWFDSSSEGSALSMITNGEKMQIALDASGRLYSRKGTGSWQSTNQLETYTGTDTPDLNAMYYPSVIGWSVCTNGPVSDHHLTVYTMTSSDTDGNGYRSCLQIAIDRETSIPYFRTLFKNSSGTLSTEWQGGYAKTSDLTTDNTLLSSDITYSGETIGKSGDTVTSALTSFFTEFIKDEKAVATSIATLKSEIPSVPLSSITKNGTKVKIDSAGDAAFSATTVTSGGTFKPTIDVTAITNGYAKTTDLAPYALTANTTNVTSGGTHYQNIDVTAITNGYATTTALNKVESIAKGAVQCVVYNNYSAMIDALNAQTSVTYNTGQNILLKTLNVPDLFVSSTSSTKTTYTYTTDEAVEEATNTSTGLTVGFYTLNQLETQKVNLDPYVETADTSYVKILNVNGTDKTATNNKISISATTVTSGGTFMSTFDATALTHDYYKENTTFTSGSAELAKAKGIIAEQTSTLLRGVGLMSSNTATGIEVFDLSNGNLQMLYADKDGINASTSDLDKTYVDIKANKTDGLAVTTNAASNIKFTYNNDEVATVSDIPSVPVSSVTRNGSTITPVNGNVAFSATSVYSGSTLLDSVNVTAITNGYAKTSDITLTGVKVNGTTVTPVSKVADIQMTTNNTLVSSDITYSGETISKSGDTVTSALTSLFTEMINNEETTSDAITDLYDNLGTKVTSGGTYLTTVDVTAITPDLNNYYEQSTYTNITNAPYKGDSSKYNTLGSLINLAKNRIEFLALNNGTTKSSVTLDDDYITLSGIVNLSGTAKYNGNTIATLNDIKAAPLSSITKNGAKVTIDSAGDAAFSATTVTSSGKFMPNIDVTAITNGYAKTSDITLTGVKVNGTTVTPVSKVADIQMTTNNTLVSSDIKYDGVTISKSGDTVTSALTNILTEIIKNEKVVADSLTDLNDNRGTKVTSGGTELSTIDVTAITPTIDLSTDTVKLAADITYSGETIGYSGDTVTSALTKFFTEFIKNELVTAQGIEALTSDKQDKLQYISESTGNVVVSTDLYVNSNKVITEGSSITLTTIDCGEY